MSKDKGTIIDAEVKQPGTALMTWKEKMAVVTAQAKATEAPKTGFLSLKGGQISYGDDPIPGNKINVIVLDSMIENYHYGKAYDGKPSIPICYAFGRDEIDLKPHPDCEKPQNPQCGTPDTEGCCPLNEWGSSPTGSRGKACSNSRRIALISADALKSGPDGVRKAGILQVKVPVTSVISFSKFVNQCVNALDVAPFGVVVEMSTKPDPSKMFTLNWKVVEQIVGDELLEALYTKHLQAANLLSQPYKKLEDEAPAPSKKF